MDQTRVPDRILNWIDGKACEAIGGEVFVKLSPADRTQVCEVVRSKADDVQTAVNVARRAQPGWADLTPVQRGEVLYNMALGMRERAEEIAHIVAVETGKSFKDAFGETNGAIALGMFMAGEGRRLYGRTLPSGLPNKYSFTFRQPIGVAGLITAANTPIANVAWKAFPALICGNAAVMKAAKDTPATAWVFGEIAHEAGLPSGVFNLIQGYGRETGVPLVQNAGVDLISFTGSVEVGRYIAKTAGERLAKVSLELGGKNPLVVCDDADLENACRWVLLSAFSNAGQRCASASRIIIFDTVYERLCNMLVEGAVRLKVGPTDEDDLGPVINETQLSHMIAAVQRAKEEGAAILTGGYRMTDPDHFRGYYMAPTIIEKVSPKSDISTRELFGPITCLYRVKDFKEALALANDCPYGLTACIHTKNVDRAIEFSQKVEAGVTLVNAGTYGSEPHMPFGGVKLSGNGFREPGTEALDVYSELKNICIVSDPTQL
jgi:aldehyde dehydrogenase (NAD+)